MSVVGFAFLVLLSFAASWMLTWVIVKYVRSARLIGVDVHKPDRPRLPKIGGLAFTASYSTVMLLHWLLGGGIVGLVLVVSPLVAAAIGLLEDVRELNPWVKPLLLLLPGIPVLLFSAYIPYPIIPLVGSIRITLLYPLLVLAAYTVVANAVNSVDVLNGSLVLSTLPVLILLAAISWLVGWETPALASLALGASLLGFLRYNWYPARVFSGNIGSNLVAAVITTVAITARLEVVTLVALLPHILNEFFIIVSMGGLKSGKAFAARPIRVVKGMIVSSPRLGDPITLVRLITLQNPMGEAAVSKRIALLSAYSSILALMTYLIGGVRLR
ncbi:putative undecaprenyl-phosphate N-acetylglucosaminyl 1-phosphate transferase [Candidatus Calditenuaceae archaeon HR02]|nr:putative undecaprenyl-phosphate N-acetylglucosaminyl 1-phosphate transferase [Candidatus Calditenuaceae archaeon HR02]